MWAIWIARCHKSLSRHPFSPVEEEDGFGTRSAKAVLGRMVEPDKDGHEARGGNGTTTASYRLRD